MRVHSALGPGLLENAYEACLLHELRKQGLRADTQVLLPVVYDGVTIDLGYRMDLLVEDLVVLELKCVEEFTPVHYAQLLSYLKLSGKNVGLLINFHVAHLRNGIKRLVNGRNWLTTVDAAEHRGKGVGFSGSPSFRVSRAEQDLTERKKPKRPGMK